MEQWISGFLSLSFSLLSLKIKNKQKPLPVLTIQPTRAHPVCPHSHLTSDSSPPSWDLPSCSSKMAKPTAASGPLHFPFLLSERLFLQALTELTPCHSHLSLSVIFSEWLPWPPKSLSQLCLLTDVLLLVSCLSSSEDKSSESITYVFATVCPQCLEQCSIHSNAQHVFAERINAMKILCKVPFL